MMAAGDTGLLDHLLKHLADKVVTEVRQLMCCVPRAAI